MKFTLAFHVFNKERTLASVLRSWLETLSASLEAEVIVVLDDLTDGSAEVALETLAGVEHRLLYARRGWEIGCDNMALAAATGDVIVFIQDDNWMHTTAWDGLLWYALNSTPRPGLVGLLAGGEMNAEGHITRIECDRPHKGPYFTMQRCADAPLGVYAVPFVTRPCAAWRDTVRLAGGFDWAYYPMDFDETDLSMRLLRSGCTNLYIPFDLVNEVGKRQTIQEAGMRENFQRGQAIFMQRHGAYIRQHTPAARLLWPMHEHEGNLERV